MFWSCSDDSVSWVNTAAAVYGSLCLPSCLPHWAADLVLNDTWKCWHVQQDFCCVLCENFQGLAGNGLWKTCYRNRDNAVMR